jgi:hypothetical protein
MKKSKKSNIKNNLVKWAKNLTWQSWLFAILLIIFVTVFAVNMATLKHLPGPLYGGDVYRNRGMILNIMNGNTPFTSSFFLDHSAYYSWMHFLGVATISSVFSIPVDTAYNLIIPILGLLINGIAFYFVSKYFFKDKIFSALIAIFAIGFLKFYSVRNIIFAVLILFLLNIIKLNKTSEKKYAIYAGICLGLVGMLRFSEFFVLILLLSIYIGLYFLIFEKKTLKTITHYFTKYIFVYVISIAIVLLLLMPIFAYHRFDAKNPVYEYGEGSLESSGPAWLFGVIKSNFFNFSSAFKGVLSILVILGIVALILSKKEKFSKSNLILFFVFVPLVLTQHFYITKPLFNKWFLPAKFVIMAFMVPIIVGYGAIFISKFIKDKRAASAVKYGCIIVLILLSTTYAISNFNSNTWVKSGQDMDFYTQEIYKLGDWMRENVPNDVSILSSDEAGFMLTGVSGKKVVVARRTHVSYYVDIEQRIADTAIIIFGTNNDLRKELIEKYKIKYFYEDMMLYRSPMRTRLKHKDYLIANGVNIAVAKERLDIARADAQIFDLVFIQSNEVNSDFRAMLKPVFGIGKESEPIGLLQEVDPSKQAPTIQNSSTQNETS